MMYILNKDDNYGDLVHEHKWHHQRIAMLVWDVCKDEQKSYPNKFLLDNMIRKIQAELSQKNLKNLPTWGDTKEQWYQAMFGQN